MKNKLAKILVLVVLFTTLFASSAYAQRGQITSNCDNLLRRGITVDHTNLDYIFCRISVLINTIIPILIALGVLYFIWGVISYAIAKDEEAKTEGRSAMIMGLIALLVIVSIWGIVNILRSTFGLDFVSETIDVPCIPSPGAPC